jgi:YVTN family beta-propeller protein/VCBS repeat-containing protein
LNSSTGTFTYTPTQAQRISAGATSSAVTVSMTVSVSDGTNATAATVSLPVSGEAVSKPANVTVTHPGAVAATNTYAYVTNKSAGTVSVINTATDTVVSTIAVGASPDGLTLKSDGTRLYVSSSTGNTVTVVNTATNTVLTTIAVTDPTAMAINSSGSVLYVANGGSGTVTEVTTSTNTLAKTVTLPAGSTPTGLTVSPDKTHIYVIATMADGSTGVSAFALSSSSSTAITGLSGTGTGLAISPDNSTLYVTTNNGTNSTVSVINTTSHKVVGNYTVAGVLAGVAVSNDGSTLVVNDTKGNVTTLNAATGATLSTTSTRSVLTAESQLPDLAVSADGTKIFVTDYDLNTVGVLSVSASSSTSTNSPPVVGTPTVGTPNPTTGSVSGAVVATDPNGNPLTYTVTTAPAKGTLVLNPDGTFSYTPTATARHAASTEGATSSLTTDAFTVTVSDGQGGTATSTVTVPISPTNTAPTIRTTSPLTNSTTGAVQAQVVGSDAEGDKLTYTVTSGPANGTVTISGGVYTYTPTAAARHAAASLTAPASAKTDTFTITADDGHGGTTSTTVTVNINPHNSAPTSPSATVTSVNTTTGTVSGAVTATDADGDTLTVTSTTPTKGTITIATNGTYRYTPTAAARQAATAANAPASAKVDPVTFTISDGYGGKTTVTLALPVTPYSTTSTPPSNVNVTVGNPTGAIGQVTGAVTATDPQGGSLTYVVSTAATKGTVNINSATGTFTYVPNVASRYLAAAAGGTSTDTFTVTIADTAGLATTKAVTVTVAPPSSSTSSIDQRGTTVAMNVQEMYTYTPAQVSAALALLKGDGVTTIRMLVPWAAVEPASGVYNWKAMDTIVNTATADGMSIDAVIDSTPSWALAGGLPISGEPNVTDFAGFAGTMATRYAGQISSYEIYNEVNAVTFWTPGPSAAQYTALLQAAYPAIKAADPNAEVVAAGLAAVISAGGLTIDPVSFLTQMYADGAGGYFDAVAYHPYNYNAEFSTGTYSSSPLQQVEAMYQVMVANGDGAKEIWATEYGEPSSIVSEQSQAAYIDDFLTTWRGLSFAGPAFIDTIQDYPSSDQYTSSIGVYRSDWTPKPAVDVFEQIIQQNEAIIAAEYGQSATNT